MSRVPGLYQGQTQSLKQSQKLMMSPQMQQAIYLLQVPVLELSTIIDNELAQNPLFEYVEEDVDHSYESSDNDSADQEMDFDGDNFEVLREVDDEYLYYYEEEENYYAKKSGDQDKLRTFLESSITSEETLYEHLLMQARETFDDGIDREYADAIIGNIDERGFLTTTIEEISLLNDMDFNRLQCILATIKDFDPFGVGAIDERETLLIQLEKLGKKGTLAYFVIRDHFDDLLHNRIPNIKKKLGCASTEVQQAIDEDISRLNIHPGVFYSTKVTPYIFPDAMIIQDGDELKITVNDNVLPSLRINHDYTKMLDDDSVSRENKEYIRQKIASGKWLLKNIGQRNNTIMKIMECLIKYQKDFFINPEGKLTPLTMKSIAEQLDVHESTIARAVANKYVGTPKGLIAMRSFFTNAYETASGSTISSRTVKDALLEIINNEDKTKPLSDEAISALLQQRDINCARRTVAKYRREFNIGNTSQRRRYG